jgi:hypothetical protein
MCTCSNPLSSFKYTPNTNFKLDDSDRMVCSMEPVYTFDSTGASSTPNAFASMINAVQTCRKQGCTCVDPQEILKYQNVYPFDSSASVAQPSGPYELAKSISMVREFYTQVRSFLKVNKRMVSPFFFTPMFRGLGSPGSKGTKLTPRVKSCTPLAKARTQKVTGAICPTTGSPSGPEVKITTTAPTVRPSSAPATIKVTTTTKAPTTKATTTDPAKQFLIQLGAQGSGGNTPTGPKMSLIAAVVTTTTTKKPSTTTQKSTATTQKPSTSKPTTTQNPMTNNDKLAVMFQASMELNAIHSQPELMLTAKPLPYNTLSSYLVRHPERSAENILYHAYSALVDYQTKLSYIPGVYSTFDPINANPSQLDAHFCTYIYSVRYGIVRATVREWARLYIYKNRTPVQEQLLKLLTVIAGEVLRLQNVNAKHIGELEENNDYVWYAGWNYDVYQRPVPSFLQKM